MGDTTEPPTNETGVGLSLGENSNGDEVNVEDITIDDTTEDDGVNADNSIISMPKNSATEQNLSSSDMSETPSGKREAYLMNDNKIDEQKSNGDIHDDLTANGRGDIELSDVVVRENVVEEDDDEDSSWSCDDSMGKSEMFETRKVRLCGLFRYHDNLDIVLMLIGTLASLVRGCAFPINLVFYGQITDFLVSDAMKKNNGTIESNQTTNLYPLIAPFCVYFVYVGVGVLVFSYLSISFWMWTAERQTRTIRKHFFHSILRQEIGWFDTHQTGELNSRLADDLNAIHDGIGEKIVTFIQWMTTFFTGFTLGFVKNWELTLVTLALTPLFAVTSFVLAKLLQTFTQKELKAYAKAGAVAEEVLGAIRTVVAFGGENKESERYNKNLREAKKMGIKKGISLGVGYGMIWLVVFSSFALAFWYGTKMIREEKTTAGTILEVFFGALIGCESLGNALPNLEAVSTARAAAASIFEVIDQEPLIDSSSDEGEKPEIVGNVEFDGIHFRYPARTATKIMNGFRASISVGQTVAFVGPSGCGKSTTLQLLQRFYDPEEGMVRIDGHDIRNMNVKWLRQHIGVVSQEPVLFATTIAENIKYGRDDVTEAEIEQVTKEANAYSFIKMLPDGFETLVGERGAQLSGGQKQRIAIARALVRHPKILLLDEATSALDTESESVVQEALEKASHGRTTIVIAHRLSTVRNADVIFGIKDGQVVESGNHDSLMAKKGLYYTLVTSQMKEEEDDEIADKLEGFIELKRTLSRRGNRSRRKSSALGFVRRGSLRRLSSVVSQQSSILDEEELTMEEEEEVPEVSMKRVWAMNSPEWLFILIGCCSALITGAVQPAFAVAFSESLGVFAIVDMDLQAKRATMFTAILAGIGAVVGILYIVQNYFLTLSGERLTERLRMLTFKAMLRQDIGWFDLHENQVGALCVRLASDTSLVKGATGSRIGTVFECFANLGTGIIISFVFGWKLTLAILCFLPIMALGGFLQMRLFAGYAKEDQKKTEECANIAMEAIENVRTVAALVKEAKFEEIYDTHSKAVFLAGTKRSHVYGIAYAFTQSVIFFAYAAAFSFGSYLVDRGEMRFQDIFKIFSAITFGGMAFGRASSLAPQYVRAKVSAAKIFQLLDREPTIDAYSTDGEQIEMTDSEFKGELAFTNVDFTYPTRPGSQILQGLKVSVSPGQTLGLVGSSGCGKSTTVQLAARFYDPFGGSVTLDGKDIRSLNLHWYRSKLGIIAQEPVLFDASIAENITYGDNERQIPMDEIIEAARKANIHSFIKDLPDGYDTNVGEKGTQLSGGQKQRVAIARALIRNPKILLLDEATSALDTESEKVVTEALDKAQEGRTCICIAHRLSTIQNADKIAVMHNGKITEIGTHAELMRREGIYYKLQTPQGRRRNVTASNH